MTRELSPEVHEHIRKLVDAAPPLTSEQRSRIAEALRPGVATAARAKGGDPR